MDQEELQEYYSEGWCHAFACAVVELHGGMVVVIENQDEDPNNTESGEEIPYVQHVLSVHETAEGRIVFDVFGRHNYKEDIDLLNIAWDHWGYRSFDVVGPMSVEDFNRRYVSAENTTKALNRITPENLDEARQHAAGIWEKENRLTEVASMSF
jgi:hypothetical protein